MIRRERTSKLSSTDKVILLLGYTGTGRSTFINAIGNGPTASVNENPASMHPCTKEITCFRLTYPGSERPIVLVDTPGFGDNNELVFSSIHIWLTKHTSVETVSIFWFCQIGNNRMTNDERGTWESFRTACGDDAMKASVTVVTTGWGESGGLDQSTTHAQREEQLQTEFLTQCTFTRLPNYTDANFQAAACEIVDRAVPGSRLLIQREAIDAGMSLSETTYGQHHEARQKALAPPKGFMNGIRKAFEFLGKKK